MDKLSTLLQCLDGLFLLVLWIVAIRVGQIGWRPLPWFLLVFAFLWILAFPEKLDFLGPAWPLVLAGILGVILLARIARRQRAESSKVTVLLSSASAERLRHRR